MASVILLTTDKVADDCEPFSIAALPLVKLTPAVHEHAEAMQRFLNTMEQKRRLHDELWDKPIRVDREAREERARGRKQQREQQRKQHAKIWREEAARLSGLNLRVNHVPFCWKL